MFTAFQHESIFIYSRSRRFLDSMRIRPSTSTPKNRREKGVPCSCYVPLFVSKRCNVVNESNPITLLLEICVLFGKKKKKKKLSMKRKLEDQLENLFRHRYIGSHVFVSLGATSRSSLFYFLVNIITATQSVVSYKTAYYYFLIKN